MKKRNIFLAALAAVMIAAGTVGSAWAYFTTYSEFSDWTKHIAITSAEDSEPAYIRVKAFSGSEYTLVYSDASGKWTPGEDGYSYYADIVEGGQTTEPLDVKI